MIRSVERALNLLLLFSYAKPRWGITEMAKATDIPKTTVHNLLRTLEEKGFVHQDKESMKYSLGRKLFTLGSTMVETLDINQKAIGPSHRLAERTGLECKVAIWDVDAVIITIDIGLRHRGFLSKRLGPRVVAYCSALGRVFLAHYDTLDLEFYLEQTELKAFTKNTIVNRDKLLEELEATRLRGYSINNEEINLNAVGIGAPIFNKMGEVIASIEVAGTPEVVFAGTKDIYIHELMETAAEISISLGWLPLSAGEV